MPTLDFKVGMAVERMYISNSLIRAKLNTPKMVLAIPPVTLKALLKIMYDPLWSKVKVFYPV